MCACRCRGARLQPDVWMNLDMRKPLRRLSQMRIEPVIFSSVIPCRGDLPGRIAEDGAKLVFYINGIAKLFFDGIDASLRSVCPDAQDIREICNLDRAHLIFSEQVELRALRCASSDF